MNKKLKSFLVSFAVGAVLCALVILINRDQGYGTLRQLCDGCFVAAVLLLGAEDLSADLRCKRTKEGSEILYARGRLVCAARAAGIEVYDTPFTDVQDLDGLEQDAQFAKGLGFSGKACISPAHVDTVNRVFSPTPADIQYAKDVFAVIAEAKRLGKGAISLRGKMIDAPIVQRARLVLEAASEIEGVDYFAETV